MKAARLCAALVAVLLVGAALAAGSSYARSLERRYVHAVAPRMFQQKNQGIALQAAAAEQPDLLLVYGSSELVIDRGPYRAIEFFQNYPTGFATFAVGKEGSTPLIILQALAALGSNLQGKRVAILASPTWFVFKNVENSDYYAGNFSRLHAYELVFSTSLSPELKRDVARRMLQFPRTLENDPLLRFALEQLAADTAVGPALYGAALPLGKLQSLVLRLQDHWETLRLLQAWPEPDVDAPRTAQRPDWTSLQLQAESEAREASTNNSFGFDNDVWDRRQSWLAAQESARSSGGFVRLVETSTGWQDLTLLLRTLDELGARPLLLSSPLKGSFYDFSGITSGARSAYYRKLRSAVKPYRTQFQGFEDHDNDNYFVWDERSHVSQKGWVFYDQALDAYFHGARR